MTISAEDLEGTPDAGASAAGASAAKVIILASGVRSKRVRWLWRGRVPLGYLTISTGESKLGKSTFEALKIAMLTRGELEGEFQGRPQSVLVVAAEDGLADLWKPRLVAVDADLDRVGFIRIPDNWNLRDDVELIDRALEQMPAPSIFIDAVMEHLPEAHGSENANAATFVRSVLRPAARLAEARGVSISISTHPPKGKPLSFADAYHGSGAFTQVSRSCLLFGWHPDDRELPEDERRRVMLRAAGNIGRNPGAVAFRIGGTVIDLDDGGRDDVGYAYDLRPCSVTARDLLNADRLGGPGSSSDAPASKVEQVAERIAVYLADGEWHPSIRAELEAERFSHGTIADAVKRVADTRKTPGTMNGPWQWRANSSNSSGTSADRRGSRAGGFSLQSGSSADQGLNPNEYRSADMPREFDERRQQDSRSAEVPESDGGYARAHEPGAKIGYSNVCHCADGGQGDGEQCQRCYGHRGGER